MARSSRKHKSTHSRRRPRIESLETRELLAADFRNDLLPGDVNRDSLVSAADALAVINELNVRQYSLASGELRAVGEGESIGEFPPALDVNGDNSVTAADALGVINILNQLALDVSTRNEEAIALLVTNTEDSGAGSLRQAILDANQAVDDVIIRFAIPTTDAGFQDADASLPDGDSLPDVFRIQPLTALPQINQSAGKAVTIDGASQATFGGDTNPFGPEIEIDGSQAGTVSGLEVVSPNYTIRGLAINRFGGSGIRASASNGVLTGNYIGTDATGTVALGNTGSGVVVRGEFSNIVIGGTLIEDRNLISANDEDGISIGEGANQVTVLGNFIGTDRTGDIRFTNTTGIKIDAGAHHVTVGGTQDGAANTISGNYVAGVWASDVTSIEILGNYVGTNSDGSMGPGNGFTGIRFEGVKRLAIGAPGAGNVISGNGGSGIWGREYLGNRNEDVTIVANRVGTDATGTIPLGNYEDGIYVTNTDRLMIGGPSLNQRNLVAYSRGYEAGGSGIHVVGANHATIQGNYIGTDILGKADFGNRVSGISISNSNEVLVGGRAEGEGNLIAASSNVEIYIENGSSNVDIVGNLLGTDASGSVQLSNTSRGVVAIGTSLLTVESNIIANGSSNPGGLFVTVTAAVPPRPHDRPSTLGPSAPSPYIPTGRFGLSRIYLESSSHSIIRSNSIGVLKDGVATDVGDGSGIASIRSYDTLIQSNVIAANKSDGIVVVGSLADAEPVQWRVEDGGNGHWYMVSPELALASEIENIYGAYGGRLVSIASAEENAFVTSLNRDNDRAWIGLSDPTGNGEPVWSTGEPLTYANWSIPPAEGQQQTQVAIASDGKWSDAFFSRSIFDHFLLEQTRLRGIIEFDTDPRASVNAGSFGKTIISDNSIGINVDSVPAIGLGSHGVSVIDSRAVEITGNSIEHFEVGVSVIGDVTTAAIRQNSIFDIGSTGISLGTSGWVNDPLDADEGPNGLQNYPVLHVRHFSSPAVITGTLHSQPNATFDIDFFLSPFDSTVAVAGREFVSTISVTTDESGNATFGVPSLPNGADGILTATATNSIGQTSVFSNPVQTNPMFPVLFAQLNGKVVHSDEAYTFGSTQIGKPLQQTLTLYNYGNQDLILQSVNATNGFSILSNVTANQVIAPGESVSLLVQFDAQAVGSTTGLINIVTNVKTERIQVNGFAVDAIRFLQ